MGRRGVAKKKTRKGGGASFPSAAGGGGGAGGRVPTDPSLLQADPSRIRFQYSRIRPVFSGCGRSVQATLDDIREGRLLPSDLPPIQVLAGPAAEGGSPLDAGRLAISHLSTLLGSSDMAQLLQERPKTGAGQNSPFKELGSSTAKNSPSLEKNTKPCNRNSCVQFIV